MATKTKSKVSHITPTEELVEFAKATCDFEGCDHKFCAPVAIESIKSYSVKVTKSLELRTGIAWVGKIYKDGMHILDVENDGWGGCNLYHPTQATAEGFAEMWAYIESAKVAFPDVKFEQEDCLTQFLDVISQIA